jgi:hypothetical protein
MYTWTLTLRSSNPAESSLGEVYTLSLDPSSPTLKTSPISGTITLTPKEHGTCLLEMLVQYVDSPGPSSPSPAFALRTLRTARKTKDAAMEMAAAATDMFDMFRQMNEDDGMDSKRKPASEMTPEQTTERSKRGVKKGKDTWDSGSTIKVSKEQAPALLDDLLSLVPSLFKMYSRCDEVDKAVVERLGEEVKDGSREMARNEAKENDVIDRHLEFESKDWRRMLGTLKDAVQYVAPECLSVRPLLTLLLLAHSFPPLSVTSAWRRRRGSRRGGNASER